ncbi:Uncharacterised protein [Vibrio cholerae]|nr:Uncharacterised protein [Vibrio cholerae]
MNPLLSAMKRFSTSLATQQLSVIKINSVLYPKSIRNWKRSLSVSKLTNKRRKIWLLPKRWHKKMMQKCVKWHRTRSKRRKRQLSA